MENNIKNAIPCPPIESNPSCSCSIFFDAPCCSSCFVVALDVFAVAAAVAVALVVPAVVLAIVLLAAAVAFDPCGSSSLSHSCTLYRGSRSETKNINMGILRFGAFCYGKLVEGALFMKAPAKGSKSCKVHFRGPQVQGVK